LVSLPSSLGDFLFDLLILNDRSTSTPPHTSCRSAFLRLHSSPTPRTTEALICDVWAKHLPTALTLSFHSTISEQH